MKKLLLLLLLTGFVSCGADNENKPVAPTPPSTPEKKYLTLEEIEERLSKIQFGDIHEEEAMTEEISERLSNLPTEDQILEGIKDLVPDQFDEAGLIMGATSIDYREHDQAIVNQFNGSCTAHATVAAMETLLSLKYGIKEKLSERDLWSKPEVYKKYSASGAMQGALNNFIVKNKYWPHSSEKPQYYNHTQYGFTRLKKGYYLGDSYKNLLARMATGETAKIAMKVPYSMSRCDKVINPDSSPVEGAGHDIAISGILVSERFGQIAIIKNSWSAKCGDGGYQYLPLKVCDRKEYWCYFWTLNDIETK